MSGEVFAPVDWTMSGEVFAPVDCPCIDASPALDALVGPENCTQFAPRAGKPDVCYPLGFGTGSCRSWDMGLAPHCDGRSPPQWCRESWCYVDPVQCSKSKHDLHGTRNQPGLLGSLFFSYGTCNSSDQSWTTSYDWDAARLRYLRVVVPDFDYPWHFKREPTGAICQGRANASRWCEVAFWDDTVPWVGAIIDYLERGRERFDFGGYNFTARSEGASEGVKLSGGKNFTAAVRDVQYSAADMVRRSVSTPHGL
jgi:hypothetical protein